MISSSGIFPSLTAFGLLHPHRAEDDPGLLFSGEEDRAEDDVDDADGDRGHERRLLRLLNGDELRNELADEHVREREEGERDRVDGVVTGGREGAAHDEERGAVDDVGAPVLQQARETGVNSRAGSPRDSGRAD